MDFIFNTIVWNPSISPFSIFGFEVRYYSLCWVIALLSSYYVVKMTYKKSGVGEDKFEPLFMYCFIGILIGARLGHCLFYEPEYYLSNPIEMLLPIRNTANGWVFRGYEGLASHGGVIGVITALILYTRKTKLTMVWTLDHIAVAAPLFSTFVRFGNFMNSEIMVMLPMRHGELSLYRQERHCHATRHSFTKLWHTLLYSLWDCFCTRSSATAWEKDCSSDIAYSQYSRSVSLWSS